MVLTLKLPYPNRVQPELGVAVGQLELFARHGWYAIKTPVAVQREDDGSLPPCFDRASSLSQASLFASSTAALCQNPLKP